jgi:glycosyltransferase involved in cell wall biosynthesis
MSELTNTMVSVCCITYNHQKFIQKTLDGFLIQKTNFDFEIVIHDDASTDKTADIIREYVKNHPTVFNPLYQEKNQKSIYKSGMNPRFNYPRAKGKYIALCDGDDYWTDPLKLQKQVNFLEQNNEYNICFHNVKVFNETTQQFIPDNITHNAEQTTTLKELSTGNFIHTPSVVFRNNLTHTPTWFGKTPMGDYPLYCLLSLNSNIYKMDKEMAVYRVHDKGAMSGFKKNNTIQRISFNNSMIPFYEYMYQKSKLINFRKELIHLLYANQSYAIRENDTALIKEFNKKLLKEHLFHLSFIQLTTTIATLFFPRVLKTRYGK